MNDLNLAIKLSTEGGKVVVKSMQELDATTQKLNNDLLKTRSGGNAARQGFDKASQGADQLTNKANKSSNELQGMIRTAGLMVSGYISIAGAMGAINRADNFNVLTQRIETATKSTGDFVRVNADLYKITQDNRANLQSTVEMFQRMASARTELEATNAQMLDFTDAIQELGIIGGTSTENIKAGQTQLAQMLSGNVARAEEFNSLLENTPEIANRIAKGLGMSVGKLREMMLDGNLLSKDVFHAILKQTSQIHRDFADIDVSIASARVQADNAINSSLSRLDEMTNATEIIATMFVDMASALDGMNAEELQELAATLTAIAGTVGAAILLKTLNVNLLALALASGTATKNIIAKVAAMRAANAQLAFYANTNVTATAKITATTVATRALTVATRALLGPIGLAITAGYLLYEAFAPDEMDESISAVNQLEQALGKAAKKIDEMTLAEQRATAAKYTNLIKEKTQEIINLQAAIDKTRAEANSSVGSGLYSANETKADIDTGELERQQQALENLKNAYSALQGEIFNAGMAKIEWTQRIKDGVEVTDKAIVVAKIELSANQKYISSLGQQIQLLGLAGKEKLIYQNVSKLSADATADEIAAVVALSEALYQQKTMIDDSEYYDKLTKGADEFSESWASAGNVIVDTFGSIGQQLEKLSKQHLSFAKQQDKINKDKLKYADEPAMLAKIAQAEKGLAQTRTTAHLSSFGAIAGAASSMFKEQSREREALHRIEMGFMAAEMVLSIEKSLLNATEAVTKAGTGGDPYSAPARVAAMIALMAGVLGAAGIAFGGGGGGGVSAADRQETQNTGTVFGDSSAKSNSFGNSFDRIEELELDQYAELQEMNQSLRSLNQNITSLAVNLIGSYGKFDENNYGGELGTKSSTSKFQELLLGGGIGQIAKAIDPTGIVSSIFSSFSKTKKTLVDSGISIVGQTLGEIIESGLVDAQAYYDVETKKSSWWGLKKKYSTNTEYQDLGDSFNRGFALIFGDIASSINQAVDILGLDVAKETNNFQRNLRNAFEGKGKFEPADFDEFFDTFNDGLVEGATRSLDNFQINLPKLSFKGMSGEEIEQELQAMVSNQADLMAQYLVPQIAEFQQVGEGLYETLVRVAQEQAIFNSAMDAMGHSISGVAGMTKQVETEIAQAIIGLMGGLDNFREYTSTYFNEFLTDDEQFEYLKNNLNELFAGLEQTLPATREEFKALIGSIDITTESGQALYAALSALFGPLDQYYDELERNKEQVKDTAQAEQDLAKARADFVADITKQLAQLDMSPLQIKLANLQEEFNNYKNEASELGVDTALLEQLYAKKRTAIVEDALAAINSAHERSVSTLIANNDRLKSSFASLGNSLSNSILSIQRQGANWNESSYQSGQINDFSALLGQGTIDEQITNIGNLENAYVQKYNAELERINSARDAAQNAHNASIAQANERYQLELDIYNSIKQTLESLKQAADDLLLSDFSTLTNQQRFDEAKTQFESIYALAQTGDSDALSKLAGAGNNYLGEAQNFYASGSNYTDIFDLVHGAFSTLGTQNILAPSQPVAPPVPASITSHNSAVKALQESTVEKLLELKELTAELEAQSESEFNLAMTALNEQLAIDTALIQAEIATSNALLIEQTQVLQRLVNSTDTLGNRIYDASQTPPIIKITIPPPMIHPPKPETVKADESLLNEMKAINEGSKKQLSVLESQAKQAELEAQQLRVALRDQKMAFERQFDELEKFARQA